MDKELVNRINHYSVYDLLDSNRYGEHIYEAASEVVSLLDGVAYDKADVILKVARKTMLPSRSVVCSREAKQSG